MKIKRNNYDSDRWHIWLEVELNEEEYLDFIKNVATNHDTPNGTRKIPKFHIIKVTFVIINDNSNNLHTIRQEYDDDCKINTFDHNVNIHYAQFWKPYHFHQLSIKWKLLLLRNAGV